MASVLRRCLDCDCTFTVTSQCPRCASTNSLILPDVVEPGLDLPKLGALLLIGHALLVTLATNQSPGLLLGSFLFANGLCAVLLLLGMERMPQALRICGSFSVIMQVAMMAITGQALLFLPAMVMVIAGILLLYQDSTVGWLRPVLVLGAVTGLALVALVIAAHSGAALPGWWQGRYLFRDRELKIPGQRSVEPSTLPAPTQP